MWKVVLGSYNWKHKIHTLIEGFRDSKVWSGKITWFGAMICGSGSVSVDLFGYGFSGMRKDLVILFGPSDNTSFG